MSVNVDLLRRTLAHIEQHPEEWDQNEWHCGTVACFAGHAAIINGASWAGDGVALDVITADGSQEAVWIYAKEALGITHEQANGDDESGHDGLFYCYNTLDDLRRIVGDLCDGAA